MKRLKLSTFLLLFAIAALAQDKGVISGNFQSNFSIFLKDTMIGADETASLSTESRSVLQRLGCS